MRWLGAVLLPFVASGLVARTLPWCDQRTDRFLLDYDVNEAGLLDKLRRLDIVVKDALQLKRTLLLRRADFIPMHNRFRKTVVDLSKYVRVDNMTASVPGKPPCLVRASLLSARGLDHSQEQGMFSSTPQLPCDGRAHLGDLRYAFASTITRYPQCSKAPYGMFRGMIPLSPEASSMKITLPMPYEVERLAQRVFEAFPPGSWFAHVRRGDAILECQYICNIPNGSLLLGDANTGAALLPVWRDHVPKGSKVFLATDEADKSLFAPLAAEYNIVYESDFGLTEGQMRYPDLEDNYFTFRVTSRVWDLFRKSPDHKVLVADRYGDIEADVEVCNTASTSKDKGRYNELLNNMLDLVDRYKAERRDLPGMPLSATNLSKGCNEAWAARLNRSLGSVPS